MRSEPALFAALSFPMANPSSQVSVVVGFPTPSRRPETEEPTLGAVSPRRTCQSSSAYGPNLQRAPSARATTPHRSRIGPRARLNQTAHFGPS